MHPLTSPETGPDNPHAGSAAPNGIATWLLYAVTTPLAAFEAISTYSTLKGAPAFGAIGGLLVCAAIAVGLVVAMVPKAQWRAMLARAAVLASVLAIVCVFALAGKIATATSAPADGAATIRAALLMIFQLGWATTCLISANQAETNQLRFIPAALGGIILVAGGFLSTGAERATAVDEVATEKFLSFPHVEVPGYARETDRAGNAKRGSG